MFVCAVPPHEPSLDPEGEAVTVTVAVAAVAEFDAVPVGVRSEPALQPDDVVPLARRTAAALPLKGRVKMALRVGSALATSRLQAVSRPHHQSGL